MREGGDKVDNLAPLLSALASTVRAASGRPRALSSLDLHVPTSSRLFAAASLPQLQLLHVVRARRGWLSGWAEGHNPGLLFPQLEKCVLVADAAAAYRGDEEETAVHFLRTLSHAPLKLLSVLFGQAVLFDAAAFAQLAQLSQLAAVRAPL